MFDNRSRKRAHSPGPGNNQTSSQGFQNRGPFQFQGGRPANKRFCPNDGNLQAQDQFNLPLKDKIIYLASTKEKTALLSWIISGMSDKMDESSLDLVVQTVCKCTISFPSRIPVYSTLISLITTQAFKTGSKIINELLEAYSRYLSARKWQETVTIAHVFSCLVNNNVLKPVTLLSFFETLLDRALTSTNPHEADFIVYTVMSSITYVASTLNEKANTVKNDEIENDTDVDENNEDKVSNKLSFDDILLKIRSYLENRNKDHIKQFKIWISGDTTDQMDRLDSLMIQLENFKANNWMENFVPKPILEKEWKDRLASLVPIADLTLPTLKEYPLEVFVFQSKVVLRLFEDSVTEDNKPIIGSDKIERFCFENQIRHLIDERCHEPQELSKLFFKIPGADKVAVGYIVVEVILGELFTLPKPKYHEMVYCALIRELCVDRYQYNEVQPNLKMGAIVNQAIQILFTHVEDMNQTCLNRFIRWFTYHLNETKMIFCWKQWSDSLKIHTSRPAYAFTKEVLSRLTRLRYHANLMQILDTAEHLFEHPHLIPPKPEFEYKPVYANHPKSLDLAILIEKLIVEKAKSTEFNETLHLELNNCEKTEGYELPDETYEDKLLKVDSFVCIILKLALKSLTHISSAIAKYNRVFKALVKHEGCQVQLLRSVQSCLTKDPQTLQILVEKFLRTEIVDQDSVLDWIFSQPNENLVNEYVLWDILSFLTRYCLRNIKDKATGPEVKIETDDTTSVGEEDIGLIENDLVGKFFIDLFYRFRKIINNDDEYMQARFINQVLVLYYDHYEVAKDYLQDLKRAMEVIPFFPASLC